MLLGVEVGGSDCETRNSKITRKKQVMTAKIHVELGFVFCERLIWVIFPNSMSFEI